MDGSIDRRLSDIGDKLIGIQKGLRLARADRPANTLIKGIASLLIAHSRGGDIARTISQYYPSEAQKIVQAMNDPLAFLVSKAVTQPAMTGVTGWAAELAAPASTGLFSALAPASVYSQLAARSLRLDLGGYGSLVLPRRAAPPAPYNVFVGEGQPIPARAFAMAATPISTKKAALISHFSGELAKRSAPSIESVLRQTLAEDIGISVDAVLLSASPATPVAPAGLLFGVAPLTASAEAGAAAISADLAALLAAIAPALDPILIMGATQQVGLAQLPGAQPLPVFTSTVLDPGTVIALDAADFVTAVGDDVAVDVVDDAIVHQSDAPLPVVDGAGVVAAPVVSLWQQNLYGIRAIEHLGWTLRSGQIAWVEGVTW